MTSRKVSQPLKTGKEKEAVVGVFLESIIRTETKILLYRTPSDIVQHKEKALGEKEVAGFIHMEPLIEVRKTPLVANPSPFVLDATKATLKIIEENTVEELSQKSDSPSKTLITSPPPDDTANTFYAPVRHRPVCHHDNWLMGCRRNHGNHGNHAQPWQSWIEEEH